MKTPIFLFFFILIDTSLFSQTIIDTRFAEAVRKQCPTCLNERNQLQEPAQKLAHLNINYKQIRDLSGIEGFSGLMSLDCSNNLLKQLPFMPNPYLRHLRCANNRLTSLPFLPESLLYLDCSGNKINFIPGLPRALYEFIVNGNALKRLPELPVNLMQLSCVANHLEDIAEFPDGIVSLDIAHNQLRKIPKLPTSLTKLIANNNLLDSLPLLPYMLKKCSVAGNNLTKLPILPESMQVLNLDNNRLDSLPSLPTRLSSFSFANNKISVIYVLPPALKDLDCRNNLFTDLPRLPRRLMVLKLKGNSVPCLPNMPEKLTKIDDETMSECLHPHFGLIEPTVANKDSKKAFQSNLITASESQLVPYRKGTKWGFTNSVGEIRVIPRFDAATLFEKNPQFSYSFSIVTKDNLKGVIDIEGEYVIPPDYAQVHALNRGGFIAQKTEPSNWIYITEDAALEETIPRAVVEDPVFKRIVEKQAYIAAKNMTELVADELFVPFIFRNDNAEVGYVLRKKILIDKYTGTYHTTLMDSIPPQYSDIKYLSPISFDTLLAKGKNGKWGMITTKNETIVPFIYEDIRKEVLNVKNEYDIKTPYLTAKKNGKWGVISMIDSMMVLDHAFDEVEPLWVKPYNVINKDSQRLFLRIKKEGKWGLMSDRLWVAIVPVEYDNVELDKETDNGFRLVKGNKMGYYIIPAEKTIPARYKKVCYFKNGFAEVVTEYNALGFVNENGDEYFID